MARDPFQAAGTLRPAYDQVDWAATPLGAVETWDATLLGAVDLTLGSGFPVTLLWGPELVLIYNEAYVQLIDDKHPRALGSRCEDVFPEAWDAIGPMLHGVLDGGHSTWASDQFMPLERSGFLEELFFTFSYSPVHGPDGRVQGVIDITVETTSAVVTGRRLEMLTRLNARLATTQDLRQLVDAAEGVFATAPADLPQVTLHVEGHPSDPQFGPRPEAGAADVVLGDGTAGTIAWVPVGTVEDGRSLAFGVLLSPMLAPDKGYLDFLRLLGFTLGQHVKRLAVTEAERTLSTALQMSLLTEPPRTTDLEVAVRYHPAAELARVGGDWYDAFARPDGRLAVVVGDVAGHDHGAAATMGQLRNLVRGVTYMLSSSPSEVLAGLDRTMAGLGVDITATAIVAAVEAEPDGRVSIDWSSAGHVPPMLLHPDGSVEVLEVAPDVLLGVNPATTRRDHAITLPPGSSLVLYTDGLVERRRVPLDTSLLWLVDVLREVARGDAEQICDHILAALGGYAEDDVALLVLRAPAG